MLKYFTLYVLSIANHYCSDAEEIHNVFLKGNAEYKIEYSVGDDDIEMITKDQLIPFKINDKENKFRELNKMCKREYYRTIRSKSVIHKHYRCLEKPNLGLIRNSRKRSATYSLQKTTSAHLKHGERLDIIDETEYNYEALLDEYYAQAHQDEKSNETYHAAKIDPKGTEIMKFLKRVFKLNTETEQQSHHRPSRELTNRIWKMSQIWLFIYFTTAIPLWCTLGWCCSCLCCKSLKAHETITEARRYMIWNPPGILRDNRGDILYEPSNKEIETYEELEHLIRTL